MRDVLFLLVLLLILLVAGCATPASTHMATGQQVMPPLGYISFCLRNPHDNECSGGTDKPQAVTLTDTNLSVANMINDAVNRLPQVEDEVLYHQVEYWAYATANGGDCEDLALEKEKLLLQHGWPQSALLLTVVKDWGDEGHTVLVMVTDKGDYVLDNKNSSIVRWEDAPYIWIKQQSKMRPFIWLNLNKKTFRNDQRMELPALGKPAPFLRFDKG